MTKTCPSCYSCGMPLEKAADHSLGNIHSPFCMYCTDEKGNVKPYEDIVKGLAHYLVHSQGIVQAAALEMAKETIAQQPHWKQRI